MANFPHPNDDYAIPGSIKGGKTLAQSREDIQVDEQAKTLLNQETSLQSILSRTQNLMKWHLSALAHVQEEPKYISDSTKNYLAGGSLTLDSLNGTLEFNKRSNDNSVSFLEVSQKSSRFVSQAQGTTVGSTLIDTIDGYIMHPLSVGIPSTPFTPVKGWLKQLFPSISIDSITTITIIELVQALLLSAVDSLVSNTTVTNTKEKSTEKDLGIIIIENPDIFFDHGNL